MKTNKSQVDRRPLDFTTLDRTAVQTFASFQEADQYDREFWWSRTPEERLQALEHIRQIAWGYDDQSRPEFQRSIRVLKLRRRSVPGARRLRS